jgi:peptidylprolyl isomerase
VRTLTAAIITVGLIASLAACSSTDAASSCATTAKSGDASSIVSVKGDVGKELDVTFPTPLITSGIEATTISEGDGRTLQSGDVADFHLTVIDGETGDVLDTGLDPDSFLRASAGNANTQTNELGKALGCATVGSRVAVTLEFQDLFGEQAEGASAYANDDTLVAVVDVIRGFPGRATGAPQLPVNGQPAVVLAPTGQPGIVVPNSDAPEKLQISTTKLGDGKKVKEDDAVVIQSSEIVWGADDILTSTWDTQPSTVLATADRTGATAGVLPGLAKALKGATIGSQLVVVIPPGDDSYDETATLPTGVTAEDTLVFVVDVLGVLPQ